jgi:hypothetical protein
MSINHTKLWAEGRYVDLWTIPHILAGVLLGGYLYWFGVPLLINITITAVLIISWEFFELHFLGVHEHLTNSLMDILVALIGFIITHIFIIKYSIEIVFPYLLALTIIYIFLNSWGFLAYKRKKLEQDYL